MEIQPNYFTCTLGQAKEWNDKNPHEFHTIPELIKEQAETVPDRLAIAFADWNSEFHTESTQRSGLDESKTAEPKDATPQTRYTFKELRHHVLLTAMSLESIINKTEISPNCTMGLMSNSNAHFLLTWLALVHMGYPVLLLAPQLEPAAVDHLCRTCQAQIIFHDAYNAKKLEKVSDINQALRLSNVAGIEYQQTSKELAPSMKRMTEDIAYYFHTSGTSSGLPKPIPQTHHAAVGVLPNFRSSTILATFSTTPLYHGGIADCFRAWTSQQPICLFPEGRIPITADNILRCIHSADRDTLSKVAYFTSVPYILELVNESKECLERIIRMERVGVGGAALSKTIGDELVGKGVKLISRFGSAECGFLLSSDRNFLQDQEWQFLRTSESDKFINFEKREEGLSELVVLPGWPQLSKVNRDDGSYATADLFEPHSSVPNAWRYHSRADAQIVLANGKKFDPSPLEVDLKSSKSVVRDVVIFGSGRDYVGALIFPTFRSRNESDIMADIWPIIERLNGTTQSHTRISRHMAIIVNTDAEIPKSSKGTIMRNRVEQMFSKEINAAYKRKQHYIDFRQANHHQYLQKQLIDLFREITGRHLDPKEDLYQQGVDSMTCVQIRNIIESDLQSLLKSPLPLNIIYDCGNIELLTEDLVNRFNVRHQAERCSSSDQKTHQTMQKMAENLGNFSMLTWKQSADGATQKVIVLTGATGMLGTYLLNAFRADHTVCRIYCLLRASSYSAAHERVTKALRARNMAEMPAFENSNNLQARIVCLPCKIQCERLGLSLEDWNMLAKSSTTIVHAAWTVNFTLGLSSFSDHLNGLKTLIALSASSGADLTFISSTATVLHATESPVTESISSDPATASPIGYAQSKWVAEQICHKAYSAIPNDELQKMPRIKIIRIGQLCGDVNGHWNMSEAYPLIWSTANDAGCQPNLDNVSLNWLPVDQAAQIVLELIGSKKSGNKHHIAIRNEDLIYHVLNQHEEPSWAQALYWILNQNAEHSLANSSLEIVSPKIWIQQLENLSQQDSYSRPWIALLQFWKDSMTAVQTGKSIDEDWREDIIAAPERRTAFSVECSRAHSPSQFKVAPLSHKEVCTMWNWVQSQVKGS